VKDTNTCPHCRQRNRIEDTRCNYCNQQILLPAEALLAKRIAKVALHELGHSFGLDHQDYEEEIDCLMVGDASAEFAACPRPVNTCPI